jgi:predicted component of type VI protein secretion system
VGAAHTGEPIQYWAAQPFAADLPPHARILADAGGYFVEDLGSANGTFLNDRRLPGGVPTRLRNGDRVRIGKVQCNFILGG